MHAAVPTAEAAASRFRRPTSRPSRTVAPAERLVMTLVTVCMICPPVDTADTSAAWPKVPTTQRSTAPYMDWRHSASSTGSVKRRRGSRMPPSVKFRPSFMGPTVSSFKKVLKTSD